MVAGSDASSPQAFVAVACSFKFCFTDWRKSDPPEPHVRLSASSQLTAIGGVPFTSIERLALAP
jgi:hypothetical protein